MPGRSRRDSTLVTKLKDPYEVLGVGKTATADEIKRAYRQLALRYHPDKLVNSTPEQRAEAEKKFQDVSRANGILSHPNKRAVYDEEGERGILMMEQIGEEMYMRIRRFGPWLKGLLCLIGVITCGFCCCFGCCFCCCCFCFGKCRPKIDEDEEASLFATRTEEHREDGTVIITERIGTFNMTMEPENDGTGTSGSRNIPQVEHVDETKDELGSTRQQPLPTAKDASLQQPKEQKSYGSLSYID